MALELTPERRAFLSEEAARIGVPEDEIADRAIRLYQSQMAALRDAVAEADAQVERGETAEWQADEFKQRMQTKYAQLIGDEAR